jgi:tRNA A-37 threonylcarbamoyl transferase component Bud32
MGASGGNRWDFLRVSGLRNSGACAAGGGRGAADLVSRARPGLLWTGMSVAPDPGAGGHRVGRYELIRRLAVGGMAEIYLARVPGLGIAGSEKLIVLKRILPQHALDPELLRMFLDEARLSATLSHPHVTEVYDVGTDGDTPFFIMEYVHGANLRQMQHRARARADGAGPPVPLEHAVGIVAAAAGLHYAHDKSGPGGEPLGIVHRDVSPSNVLVSYHGAVKVSDFGIAKWAFQRTQTQDGALKGKFAYMSPEQCRGQPLDRRSDVFALGTILYELTTGAPPFAAAADMDILNQIVGGSPAPPAWPADGRVYPAALAAIVMRALARDPADRYPTAQALQVELEAFARSERLEVSTMALASYMRGLFADELGAWEAAHRAGQSLGDHLAEGARVQRAAEPTVRTATDAFVAGGRRGGGAKKRWVVAVVAGAAAAVVGFAGMRWSSRSTTTTTTTTTTTNTNTNPSAATKELGGSTGAERKNIVESHPIAPSPAAARPVARRGNRARAVTEPPPSAESRLHAWDPDSPVPPR